MGLGHRWEEVRKAYAVANKLLGGIIKVTPSSKVVGDFSLFIVQNNLDEASVVEKATELDFPDSVLDFMNGKLGIPEGGFLEPLRSRVLKGKAPLVNEGERPGYQMKYFDFELEGKNLSFRTAVPLLPED
jgi:pyruvate carboxylase